MANTASMIVPSAQTASPLTAAEGGVANLAGKPLSSSGQKLDASAFHQLLTKQSATKASESTLHKQSSGGNEQLDALLALLAGLGIVQVQPNPATAVLESQENQMESDAVPGMSGMNGIPAAPGSKADQVIQALQQLVAHLSSSSYGAQNGSSLNTIETLIQHLGLNVSSQNQSSQDLLAALTSMLEMVKSNGPVAALSSARAASIPSVLQQGKGQPFAQGESSSVAGSAAVANARTATHGLRKQSALSGLTVVKQGLSTPANEAGSALKSQHLPAVRTQLSAWQHQVKIQLDAQQQDPAAKEDTTGVTDAAQSPFGTIAGGILPAKQVAEENLQIKAADLPQQLQSLIVKNSLLQEQGGSRLFRITLVPEGLGEIKVLVLGDSIQNQISVQFLTDQTQTQDLLNSSLSALRSDLEAMGVHLHKVEVDSFGNPNAWMGNTGSPGFLGHQSGSQHQQFSGENRRQKAETQVDSRAARDDWSSVQEQAGLETAVQINLTA